MHTKKAAPVLSVNNLVKTFKTGGIFKKSESFTAVNNISFQLQDSEILGLLGPNGAGKTTTIQMLLGLLTPTSGSINYFGKDLLKDRSEIMQKVTFASSYLKLPGSLSVEENLNIYGKIYSLPTNLRKSQIEKNLDIFGLKQIRSRLTKNLSAGQLTRLMLAKAFLPEPKIILLDEPTAALDPDIAMQVRQFILDQRKNLNVSVLFTSHNMAEVEELCDRVLILKNGTILASETPAKLAATVKISKLHLVVSENLNQLITYAQKKHLPFKIEHNSITMDIDEHQIADLIFDITKLEVKYTQISIDKPTLEDYFLEISKGII